MGLRKASPFLPMPTPLSRTRTSRWIGSGATAEGACIPPCLVIPGQTNPTPTLSAWAFRRCCRAECSGLQLVLLPFPYPRIFPGPIKYLFARSEEGDYESTEFFAFVHRSSSTSFADATSLGCLRQTFSHRAAAFHVGQTQG